MRKIVVAVVTALLVGAPAVAANATIDHCPAGVSDVRGVQPTWDEIATYLAQSAVAHSVPLQVLRAVAYQESHWRQFNNDGTVVVSGDTVCGLGIMQITADTRDDAVQLANDWQYNVDVGASFLYDKWVQSQSFTHAAPNGYPADSPHALENWYYALCLYNGCSGSDTYASAVANIIGDPFRYIETNTSPSKNFLPYGGFTKPGDADPTYVFPNAFQADLSPQQFVYYDSSTGDVTKIVAAPTHDDRAVHPSYGAGAYGPDGPWVECDGCIWWRLFEGRGVTGRAHWTHSVATPDGVDVRWEPDGLEGGTYRVSAYVPDVTTDTEAMGSATYHISGHTPVTVDQAASVGQWVTLCDCVNSGALSVTLDDVSSDPPGRRIVADAIRFAKVTTLALSTTTSTVTYGGQVTLMARLLHGSAGLYNRPISLYKRTAGTTAWVYAGNWKTDAYGIVRVNQTPTRNAEYQFRYLGAGDATASTSPTKRVDVRTKVTGVLSRTTVAHGVKLTAFTTVSPNHAAQNVLLQRYYGGVWHNVVPRALSSSSTASYTFAVSTPGTYKYRWYKPADSDHAIGWGPTMTLTVT